MATIRGGRRNDTIVGTESDDFIEGAAGADVIQGLGGNDYLLGGSGADTLTGGDGGDTFAYAARIEASRKGVTLTSDSSSLAFDVITDFESGMDKIDLSAVESLQPLAWSEQTPTAFGVWYAQDGNSTLIFVDIDGVIADSQGNPVPADLVIRLEGQLELSESDFLGLADLRVPVITSNGGGDAAAVSVAENDSVVTTVVARDRDSAVLTYSISGGADAGLFAIHATTGALSFISAPDFENPADADGNNIYDVVVTASDGESLDSQAIAVTVTDVGGAAPLIRSDGGRDTAAVSVAENDSVVTTVVARDRDSAVLTYSISGGADAGLFAIHATTGALSFISAPDFENPADADGNNIYDVVVTASDGESLDSQVLAVTVTDVNDNGTGLIGDTSGDVEEDYNFFANGTLSNADGSQASVVAQPNTVGIYGTFSITATGDWFYSLDNSSPAVQGLGEGEIVIEEFVVTTQDGVVTETVRINITGDGEPTTVTGLVISASGLSFTASDADASLSYTSPFDASVGIGTINNGTLTTLTATAQSSAQSGELQITDGTTATSVGVYLGLGSVGDDSILTAEGFLPAALYGFDGNDTLTGSFGNDWIEGGSGNDTLEGGFGNDRIDGGSGNDVLRGSQGADRLYGGIGDDIFRADNDDVELHGGDGADTLVVSSVFVAPGDNQLTSIENVLLTVASTLNLGNQSEDFVITGSSAGDTIIGGAGSDNIMAGGDNDIITVTTGQAADLLLDGGADTDTLRVTSFASASDAQIVNIENVAVTGNLVTVDLSNQTEGFVITAELSATAQTIIGSGGADSISTGGGNDIIVGAQNDILLDGGAEADELRVYSDFIAASDGQIVNIETVTLMTAALINLSNQTEAAFTIIGSSGNDSIITGSGVDTILGGSGDDSISSGDGDDIIGLGSIYFNANEGADSISSGDGNDTIYVFDLDGNDVLLDGGADLDVLVAWDFTSASDGQIINIEKIYVPTAEPPDEIEVGAEPIVSVDLSNQTEGFTITTLGTGPQHITGSSGADSISAGDGNDTIGGTDNDTLLDGGVGTDVLSVAANFTASSDAQIVNVETVTLTAAALLDLSNQTETFTAINGSAGNDTIIAGIAAATINGNAGNDVITGSSFGDTILGEEGDDTIMAGDGDDAINGGAGSDHIEAGGGNDFIVVNALGSADLLLDGGADADTLIVESFVSASDAQIVNIENVTITGNLVTVDLSNQTEGFVISAGLSATAQTIIGSGGADSISTGAGNDTIAGAQNDILLDGGADTDILRVLSDFTAASDGQIVNIETVTLMAAALVNLSNQTEAAFTINGSSGNDSIITGSGVDTILGGSGDDSISSGSGNDIINGNVGADSISAGDGNDSITVTTGQAADLLLDGGADIDTLNVTNFTSASDAQVANIENVIVTAAGTVNLSNQTEGFTITTVGTGVQSIIGSAGADSISTDGGNDTIGGTDNDTLLDGGVGTDVLNVAANFTASSDAQIVNIETVTLTAAALVDLSNQTETFTAINGSAGNDTIIAGIAAATINGNAGNDVITGSGNADTINAGTGSDTVSAGGGNDAITVGSSDNNDVLLDGGDGTDTLNVTNFASASDTQIINIENVIVTAAGTVNLSNQTEGFTITTVGTGVQTIIGSAGADSISTDGGNDTIGGTDNDTLLDGGVGADVLSVAANFTASSDAQIVNIETVTLTAAALVDLSNQTETFTAINGSAGNDTIIAGIAAATINGNAGNDVITGSGNADTINAGTGSDTVSAGGGNDAITVGSSDNNDVLLDGGDGTDTLNVTNFASASDTQIINIENVIVTAAGTVNLSNQTEGFTITTVGTGVQTITGSAGADSISAGDGNDTINGAQNDILLDGGVGTSDLLRISSDFVAFLDSQVVNIEAITITAAGLLDLSNQTEAFTINGSSGIDTIIAGAGLDTIVAGSGNDTIVGGAGNDSINAGGTGDQDIIRYLDVLSGADILSNGSDTITNFDADATGGLSDIIDLDALFDSLGFSDADRAAGEGYTVIGNQLLVDLDNNNATGANGGYEYLVATVTTVSGTFDSADVRAGFI